MERCTNDKIFREKHSIPISELLFEQLNILKSKLKALPEKYIYIELRLMEINAIISD
jgi:hypothetical protein